jgi:hypothetical protein
VPEDEVDARMREHLPYRPTALGRVDQPAGYHVRTALTDPLLDAALISSVAPAQLGELLPICLEPCPPLG